MSARRKPPPPASASKSFSYQEQAEFNSACSLLSKVLLMTNRFSLDGRVALVTGASRGLGFAMAQALAEHGATVIVNARDEAALSEAARKLTADHLAFDVADPKQSRAALDTIVARHG